MFTVTLSFRHFLCEAPSSFIFKTDTQKYYYYYYCMGMCLNIELSYVVPVTGKTQGRKCVVCCRVCVHVFVYACVCVHVRLLENQGGGGVISWSC